MANSTLVDTNVWDGVERRAGNNPNRIGIVLTRVRRATTLQSPQQLCATPQANAHEQAQKHERQAEALR